MSVVIKNRDFFTLPAERKAEIFHKPTNLAPQRGWTRVGVERSAKLNWGRTSQDASSAPDENLTDAKVRLFVYFTSRSFKQGSSTYLFYLVKGASRHGFSQG